MKIYRRLMPIKAISFDLDDTLYANRPVMQAAEVKMRHFFTELFAQQAATGLVFDHVFWQPFKQQAINNSPDLAHDVVALRVTSYFLGACALGYSQQEADKKAQQAMQYFVQVRSEFVVPQASCQLLAQLSEKYPLVAISNGNVDTNAIGIRGYFHQVFHAANGVKQKPDPQMFTMACQSLAIAPEQLLHVGDCGRADIQGALNAGCQAAWLSCYDVGQPLTVLPQIELSAVTELADLLL